ncbi:epoxide hydrolase [Devosia oryziradicis]|uniref:Epoxide hydrolase n=1 Tax=Devosia oryziradicis TaxID=2801335 RepID=A0ABX7BVK2_9HYPH|nr:epoxide hydrolase family protein [Devosia oryziradicis]QQR34632.1 epoxide hydrolase [Devosia oryziradicis]
MTAITPFKIAIDDAAIEDLHLRLRMARFPETFSGDWSRGQPVSLIRELAGQWLNSYDWRAWEAKLNAYPQFLTEIDGQTIHFLHVRSPEADAVPLVLTHGWPSSVVEFLPIIDQLTNPSAHGKPGAQAFHLVIPSLPGYGFSRPLAGPGWEAVRTAKAWDVLMKRLGYQRYGAQGGDGGALVTRELAILAPEGLIGVHMQQVFAFPSGAPGEMDKLSPFELAGFANLEKFQKYNGYADIQSKRPGTHAYGLVDSPVAQLAWNAELFFGFEGEAVATMDRELFLTNASIYWFTNTGSEQGNFFLETTQTGGGYREIPTAVPTAVASFPNDFRSVRTFVERSFSNIVQWSEMESGGHFATIDATDGLIGDIRSFFSQVR